MPKTPSRCGSRLQSSFDSARFRVLETAYKGYRFRSRTEARWAVCFHTLGLTWTYEVEGFDLDGIWYLPDFWCETLCSWIEIKGRMPTRAEVEKATRLHSLSGRRVLLIVGQPWPGEHTVWLFSQGTPNAERDLELGEMNGALTLVSGDGQRIQVQKPHFVRSTGSEYDLDTQLKGSALERAFVAARGTRFDTSERELDRELEAFGFVLSYGFGFEKLPPQCESVEALFCEVGLRPLCWEGHTFALAPGGHDKVGCLVVRDQDRAWAWFEIDWQDFIKRAPKPSDRADIEHKRLLARLSREVRRDPLTFFEKLGIESSISWRTLALGLHINEGKVELIVLRLTDGQWWAVPSYSAMFDRLVPANASKISAPK